MKPYMIRCTIEICAPDGAQLMYKTRDVELAAQDVETPGAARDCWYMFWPMVMDYFFPDKGREGLYGDEFVRWMQTKSLADMLRAE